MKLNSIRIKGLAPFISETSVGFDSLPGKLTAITGSNGAGKSSLLNLYPAACIASNRKFLFMPGRGSRTTLTSLSVARDAFVEVGLDYGGKDYMIRHSIDGVSGKTDCSVVCDGKAVLKNKSGSTEFLAWSADNLLPPEVFFGSVFSSQRTRGMLGMDPAERKQLILKVLGLDRYEALSTKARKNKNDADTALRVAAGRLSELSAGDSQLFCEEQIVRRTAEKRLADEALELGNVTMADLRAKNERAHKLQVEYDAAVKQRQTVIDEQTRIETEIALLQIKINGSQEVLAEADAITAAVSDTHELVASLATLKNEEAEIRVRQAAAIAYAKDRRQAFSLLTDKLDSLSITLDRLNKVLADKDAVTSAANSVVEFTESLKESERERDEAFVEYERLQGLATVGADGRVTFLRGELGYVANGHALDPVAYAGSALTADALGAQETAERPRQILTAKAAWQQASQRVGEIGAQLASLTRMADRAREIGAAEQSLEESTQEIAKLNTLDGLTEEVVAADTAVVEVEATLRAQTMKAVAVQRMVDALAPLTAKSDVLKDAQTRSQGYTEQQAALRQRLAGIEVPPTPASAPGIMPLGAYEKAIREAQDAATAAATQLEMANDALIRATAVQGRREALQAEVGTLGRDAAEWKRLGDDLQAVRDLVVDASGPRLTVLANDLLRASGDSRFSLRISTSKMDSTGKKELDNVCEIEIHDSRDGSIKTGASGGEESFINKALAGAITELACQHLGISNPTIVDDEGDSSLDVEYAGAYLLMLRRLADELDASRVLFVTHRPDLWSMADSRLIIDAGTVTIS